MSESILVGQRFALLAVVSRDGTAWGRKEKWVCQCDCGDTRSFRVGTLLTGAMRSCGCQTSRRREIDAKIAVKVVQHRAGNQLTRKRAQRILDRIDVRRELAAAQAALEQAIHNRDAEVIADARRALAEALQRLRALT